MIERIDKNKKHEAPSLKNLDNLIVSNEGINNDINNFLTGKIKKGYLTGIEALDNHFTAKENAFYVNLGKKGIGKTTITSLLHLLYSITNDLIWVVAFKENENWSIKLGFLYLLLGKKKNEIKDKTHYYNALNWLDSHFYFVNSDSVKDTFDVTRMLIKKGVKVHGVFIDPINSFSSGFSDTGNGFVDGNVTALEMLNFTRKVCSVHISQHPTMANQRKTERLTSYDAEGGWFMNKADFTYVIHRDKSTNVSEIIVENVRNKLTGGDTTDLEKAIALSWSPFNINIGYIGGDCKETNVIQKLILKHKPFIFDTFDAHYDEIMNKDSFFDKIMLVRPDEAF